MAARILDPHLKDVPYVALCLFFKGEGHEIGLWSNEKRLNKVKKYGINYNFRTNLIFIIQNKPETVFFWRINGAKLLVCEAKLRKVYSKVSPFRACGDAGRARDCEAKSLFIYASIIIGDGNGAFVGRS